MVVLITYYNSYIQLNYHMFTNYDYYTSPALPPLCSIQYPDEILIFLKCKLVRLNWIRLAMDLLTFPARAKAQWVERRGSRNRIYKFKIRSRQRNFCCSLTYSATSLYDHLVNTTNGNDHIFKSPTCYTTLNK